jgi:hypothetical protein
MRNLFTVAVAACLVLPLCAVAGMKAGQWEITTKMDLGKDAPQMPSISPDQLAQMKQMGIQPPSMGAGGAARTFKTCVSQQDADSDRPPMDDRAQRSCKAQDVKRDGPRTTLKIVCSGEMNGTGEIEAVHDSAEHYTSKMHFVGDAHGHPVDMTNTSEGRWISASCN